MPTLLAIEVSPRTESSVSRRLTAKFVETWQAENPTGSVVVRDLVKTDLPFVDLPWIGGAFAAPEQRTPEAAAAIAISDELVAELKSADQIVIGTPMYNFSIPARLKAYIDHIVRVGLTFTMNYEGLVTGKKATVIITTGGDFSPGAPAEPYNVATSYLKLIFGFIGITDTTVVMVGKTAAIDQGQRSIDEFTSEFEGELALAARS